MRSVYSSRFAVCAGAIFVMAFTTGGAALAGDTAGDPYPLGKCALSGRSLGDSPVLLVHEGREIKFCCNNCKGKFEGDPAAMTAKIDAAIAADQKDQYPLDTCVVEGSKLDDKATDFVYNNRLFRLCCADCAEKIKADPASYLAKLDAAVIEKQKPGYASTTCPVSGEKLGSMGDPVDLVVGNQLIELCCAGCKKKVNADPAKYIAQVRQGGSQEKTAAEKAKG